VLSLGCVSQIADDAQGHPINAQRAREGKPPANVVLLRGCGSRRAPGSEGYPCRQIEHVCLAAAAEGRCAEAVMSGMIDRHD
jgi:2,3-bisphosphoglycerate-independent phosphoglycerate mutase